MSVHVKWDFFFFFFCEPQRKVIEMSEKEPGSLETLRSFKCHGSSSNIRLHFYRQSMKLRVTRAAVQIFRQARRYKSARHYDYQT